MNDDPIRQARLYPRHPSGTVEDFVERKHAQRRAEDTAVDQVIDRLNAFQRTHGLLSNEFSSL